MTKEDTSTTKENSQIDLDTILVNEIGQFGWFQARTILLAIILVIFCAWSSAQYVFSTARITTRCYIPECDSNEPEFSPDWVQNVFPSTGKNTYDGCQRFANRSTLKPSADACPATWFDRDVLQECETRIYENSDSIVYDYDLGCEEWRRSLIGTFRMLGLLTAQPLVGFVSDRWGRRTTLALSGTTSVWIGILRYFANSYIGYSVFEFAECFLGAGMYTSAYIVVMEVVGPKYRVMAGTTISSFFSVGTMSTALIAWAVPNWRHLTLVLYTPQLLIILYFWVMTESVRWYMSKGRYEDSEKLLKKIAEVNGKELSKKSLECLRLSAEEEKRQALEKQNKNKNESMLVVQVIRHKKILIRCLVSPIWWITANLIYYGLSINAINLLGNKYLNYAMVAAVKIPGYWTAVLLLGQIGRKAVLIGGYWICGVCQLAYIFLPEGHTNISFCLYLVGTYCIAMVMTSIYIYTTELYPTRHRHSLLAFSYMMGKIGAMVAPLIPALGETIWVHLPYVLFATMAILSGFLVFITPETLGTKLPDTMEEASNIGTAQQA
ncbi:hypothetical protein ACJJTC_007239 [Scirpophaga incertulas]